MNSVKTPRAFRPGPAGGRGPVKRKVPDATTLNQENGKYSEYINKRQRSPLAPIRKRLEAGFKYVFGPNKKVGPKNETLAGLSVRREAASEVKSSARKRTVLRRADQVPPELANIMKKALRENRESYQGHVQVAPVAPARRKKPGILEALEKNDSASSAKPSDASATQERSTKIQISESRKCPIPNWRSANSKFDDLCERSPKVKEALKEAHSPSVANTTYELPLDAESFASFQGLEKALIDEIGKGDGIKVPNALEWFTSGRLTKVIHALYEDVSQDNSGVKPNVSWRFSYDADSKTVVGNYSVEMPKTCLQGGFEFSAVSSDDWKRLDVSVLHLTTGLEYALPDVSQPAQILDKDFGEDRSQDHPQTPTLDSTSPPSPSLLDAIVSEDSDSVDSSPNPGALPADPHSGPTGIAYLDEDGELFKKVANALQRASQSVKTDQFNRIHLNYESDKSYRALKGDAAKGAVDLPGGVQAVASGQLDDFAREVANILAQGEKYKRDVSWSFEIKESLIRTTYSLQRAAGGGSVSGAIDWSVNATDGENNCWLVTPQVHGSTSARSGEVKGDESGSESDVLVSSSESDALVSSEESSTDDAADSSAEESESRNSDGQTVVLPANVTAPSKPTAVNSMLSSDVKPPSPMQASSTDTEFRLPAKRDLRAQAFDTIQRLKHKQKPIALESDGRYACTCRKVIARCKKRVQEERIEQERAQEEKEKKLRGGAITLPEEKPVIDLEEEIQTVMDAGYSPADLQAEVRQALKDMSTNSRWRKTVPRLHTLIGERAENFIFELTHQSMLQVLGLTQHASPPPILEQLFDGEAGIEGGKFYALISDAVDAVLKTKIESRPNIERSEPKAKNAEKSPNLQRLRFAKPSQKLKKAVPKATFELMAVAAKAVNVDFNERVLYQFAKRVIAAESQSDLRGAEDKAICKALLNSEAGLSFDNLQATIRAFVTVANAKAFASNPSKSFNDAFPGTLGAEIPELNDAEQEEMRGYFKFRARLNNGGDAAAHGKTGRVLEAIRKIEGFEGDTPVNVCRYWRAFDYGRRALLQAA